MKPIGICHTCFDEKFSIPRQAGLSENSTGKIQLYAPYNQEDALRGLDKFSHLFVFWKPHLAKESPKLTVRPPRLGGNERLGVFATRSPFRPNLICHSVVQIEKIEEGCIYFKNHDILDQTPVWDIKPYLPAWDIFPQANSGWVDSTLERVPVTFKDNLSIEPQLKELLNETLSLRPQPSYQINQENEYAFRLLSHEIEVTYSPESGFYVHDIHPV